MSSASFLRKSFTGLLAILLTASVFTACGKKDENTEKGSDSEKKEEKTEKKTDAGREDFIRGKAALETKDYKTAITHLMLAADQGNAEAMLMLAECYFKGTGVEDNKEEALKWVHKVAETPSDSEYVAEAQYMLANYYARKKKDYEEALKWLRKAASNKSDFECVAEAQVDLAIIYAEGVYITKDINEAIKWYRKAAGSSHARPDTAEEAREALKRLGAD